ncbi:hypothetical protein ACA910_017040 [Epithemia clementina (nom. ined.)]
MEPPTNLRHIFGLSPEAGGQDREQLDSTILEQLDSTILEQLDSTLSRLSAQQATNIVNAPMDDNGAAPLHYVMAVYTHRRDFRTILQKLLDYRANVNLTDTC